MMKRTVAAATAAVAASIFAFGQSWAQEPVSQFVVMENLAATAHVDDPAENTCYPGVITAEAPRTMYWRNTTPYYATIYTRAENGGECGGPVLARLHPNEAPGVPITLAGAIIDIRFSTFQ